MTIKKMKPEMHEFILANYKSRLTKELTDLLNQKFGTSFSEPYIKSYKSRFKLWSGVRTQFGHGQKMHVHPKGYMNPNAVATQFKKGVQPMNTLPIGTEVLRRDGLIWVKISNAPGRHDLVGRWKQRARIVWEVKNGPLKPKEVVLHLDGNSQNDSPENLAIVTQSNLATINKKRLISKDPEITKSGILIAKITNKMSQRSKKENGKK